MTLREAIEAVEAEYDAEVMSFEPGPMRALARRIMGHEHDEIDAAHLIETITEGRTIVSPMPGTQGLPERWIRMAFRLGMRVQRKLDNPNKLTTLFDMSYTGGPKINEND